MRRPARRLAALALAALALVACGRKGPPVAPERRVPAPVADLAGLVRPDAIELTWSVPGRRADGTPLRDAAAATVFRTEDEGRGEPRSALLSGGMNPRPLSRTAA
jgi:predicted small lipoprotein YifL